MDKNTIINQAVEKAYNNIIDVIKLKASIYGGYFGLIIPEHDIDAIGDYVDEIINLVYKKICDEIATKITKDDVEFTMYKTFSMNNPSQKLIDDCFKLVNNCISNKKSSSETTLYTLLNSIKDNHSKEEIGKSLDTIFDILLDYYSIIR